MALPVFDLHCDALQRSLDMGHDLGVETPGHFDLAKAARGGVRAISLTAWIDSPYADEPGALSSAALMRDSCTARALSMHRSPALQR